MLTLLRDKNVEVVGEPATQSPWISALVGWAPFLFLIGFWIFFMRQMQSGGNKALSFGKSRAAAADRAPEKISFKDVAGVDEAKAELFEIIDFLKEPQKFQKLGRTHSQRRAAGRTSGYGQDTAGARNRR